MKPLAPVIKTKSSFSILLLRNDSKVLSFRLTSFWSKFLLFFFVIFSGLSGAAGYTAYHYREKYHALQRERSELAQIIGENRRQLGRFAGIERLKESTLPRSTMTDVTTVAAPPHTAPPAPQPSDAEAKTEQSPTATAQTPDPPQPDAQPVAQSTEPDAAVETDAAPQQVSTTGGISPEDTVTASGPGSDSESTAEHPAVVDEVQIKRNGANRFQLLFDLSNKNQQLTLNGRISLGISTKAGARHDIADVNRDTLRFVINRFKKVTTTFSLPDDVRATDVEMLYITIAAENLPDITYRFSFPSP